MKTRRSSTLCAARGLALATAIVLAACGTEVVDLPTAGTPAPGAPASAAAPGPGAPTATAGAAAAAVPAAAPAGPPTDLPASPADASRFLTKSTFGTTQAGIDKVSSLGYSGWISAEIAKAPTLHLPFYRAQAAKLGETADPSRDWVLWSFWRAAVEADDVLRQRVAFALSQIFVVSMQDPNIGGAMMASYYDILVRNAFGNYRTLLEEVSLSPAMGTYLSHLANRKSDLAAGRLPDENYAREIMQLFSIGLHELNPDGTVRSDADGRPIETYDFADIQGLAKVFTGFSWGGPDTSAARFVGRAADSARDTIPMQGYPDYHEPGSKTFLGVTIAAASPQETLRQALDVLFRHPNVGPFIGRQLIQRLVTSNPSPAYVGRVAAAFDNNGRGVRGDLAAVVRAVLLDREAFDPPRESSAVNGKLREPVLRMTALLRALDASSTTRDYRCASTDAPANSLGQSPLRSPSVFNFFRPGYVPPNSALSRARLDGSDRVPVAPELQLTNEVSVAGWIATAQALLNANGGFCAGNDVKPALAPLAALADRPAVLVDRLILLLAPAGQVPASLRQDIIDEVSTVTLPPTGQEAARQDRVRLAAMLLAVSPEFMVQR
ncbi:MAG: hypothetical protein RJA99_4526 [Pseudomonadota bacterium]|jgi:uncharacterized protein (DUF1800 family)